MKNKVKFGSFETVYEGRIFKIKKREVTFPDGFKQTHEYCQRFNSVTVLPFDEKGRLLLTREVRIGEQCRKEWFLTCGRIDKGETARQAAQRELREEIGYRAKTLKLINKKSSGSEYFIWDIYLFVAKDLVKAPLSSGDEHFPIEVVPTPLNKAVKMALDGTIQNESIAFHIIRFDYMLKHGQFKW
jgi:ADP-ribose diphosphatase